MKWLDNFPTHNATVAAGIFVFVLMGMVIAARLALGLVFPDGYTPWIAAVVTAMGVATAGGFAKRATDINLALAKKGIVSTPPATAAPEPAPKTE